MRILYSVLALLGVASAFESQGYSQNIRRNTFGAMEVIDHFEGGSKKTVMKALKPFSQDYIQQAEFLSEAMDQIKINQEKDAEGTLYSCDNRGIGEKTDPLYFVPIFVADLKEDGETTTFTEGLCYKSLTFTYNMDYDSAGVFQGVTLTIDAKRPSSLFCRDWFFIANTDFYHVETISSSGVHTISFTNLDETQQINMAYGGLNIYMFCDGYIDTFISAFKTVLMFVGGLGTDPDLPIRGSHVPEYMENLNKEFLKQTMGYELIERDIQEYEYDTDLIQSGDYFAIYRLDGLDPIIMYGTGSYNGHTTMALRFDGELYIVESQDAWYWPVHRIQRNKFADWMEMARNADFHVSHIPMKQEFREKFNEKAAIDFFYQTEGLPYGYHNFLYGWLDTPEDNLPPVIPSDLLPIIFAMLEKVIPETIDIFYTQGLNKRMGTVGLDISGVTAEAAKRDLTIEEVIAMPEQDFWEYTGEEDDGWSYVCCAYVAAMYKAAGLFDDMEIQATEFAPVDLYTLSFFDTAFERPEHCESADPDQPHCQLLGKYRMIFPRYSTIDPYEHMCEACPSVAPDYYRPEFC